MPSAAEKWRFLCGHCADADDLHRYLELLKLNLVSLTREGDVVQTYLLT